MAPTIWSKLPTTEQVALIAAGLVAGATPALADEQVQIVVQDGAKIEMRVQVQGGQGQANVQVRVGIVGPNGVMIQPAGPTSMPAEIKPTITVKQEKPGEAATFTFALPDKAPGTLAEAPDVTTFFGEAKVVEKSLTKTACQFTWDLAAVRKENPALRGSELSVAWKLAPPAVQGQPAPEPNSYTTTAHLTLTADGAVAVTGVETVGVLRRIGPMVCEMAPMPAYRYSSTVNGLAVGAMRFQQSKTTSLTVRISGGHQFTAQPEIKTTVGAIAERPKWNDKVRQVSQGATWEAPKELPKEDKEGAVTWSFPSREPVSGEEKSWTVTMSVKMSKNGDLTVTKVESSSKVTKEGRRPEVCEMAPAPGLRQESGVPRQDDLPLPSRFAAHVRAFRVAPDTVRLSADVAYTDADGLTFAWSVTGGTLDATNARDVVWTLPATPGKVLAQVVVTDRHGGMAVPATIVDV